MKIEAAIIALNRAADADPRAIRDLIEHRVPANRFLADHSTAQVLPEAKDGTYSIGALGLLNAAIEAMTGERIAVQLYEDGTVLGFCKYSEVKTSK